MYFQSLPPDEELLKELLEQEVDQEPEKNQSKTIMSTKIVPMSDVAHKTNATHNNEIYNIAL